MRSIVIVSMAAVIGLSGCTGSEVGGQGSATGSSISVGTSSSVGASATQPTPTHTTTSGPPSLVPTHSATRSAPPSNSAAAAVLAGMTEAQRVGQLLMVDNPSTSVSSTTMHDIADLNVGGVILDGNSSLSVSQTRSITNLLQAAAQSTTNSSAGLLIATDQEGGLVRRLRGPGFTAMPSALVQGSYSVSVLRSDAATWGAQLRAAGVNVDLAPVMDTVPSNSPGNPPIGDLDREYGHDTATVASHGTAVAQGLASAGLAATIKHFPGLGRVSGNTDTTSGVTDTVTTRYDPYLVPFTTAMNAGAAFVMMSTAIYRRIDPGVPAAFSSTIVTDMLRGDLQFRGVIISDDLGAAKQVAGYSVGARAVDFVAAGGDIVLTVNASQASAMISALLARAASDQKFKAQVDAAALIVLQEKAKLGLLS